MYSIQELDKELSTIQDYIEQEDIDQSIIESIIFSLTKGHALNEYQYKYLNMLGISSNNITEELHGY